jgi:asparagine synthase (glutamine-hydrolysing)
MCGIYGRWNLDGKPIDATALQRATRLLRHRGPDDEGYLLVDSRSQLHCHCRGSETDPRIAAPDVGTPTSVPYDLAFGFRRLSILDLSPAGHQPMSSPDGRLWLIFNGEIYNFAELRTELRQLGHPFRGDSDTEVILAAFREWGAGCLHRFNGMWALAIWDRDSRSLFLARDRFGVKPLFYVRHHDFFAFASEIKPLVGGDGVPFRPVAPILYDFLASGTLPSPTAGTTFFEDVWAVPPGHQLRVTRDGMSLSRWYTLPTDAAEPRPDVDRVVDEYRDLLTDAVRLRLRSDVPVGSCLSGGVDSSSIVCIVNRLLRSDGGSAAAIGDRQKTFSAVYDSDGPYNERRHIEKVLHASEAEANLTFPTADRLLGDAERMVWHQDEPFTSTSIFAQWCVMHKARERGVTVLLDGQGADEALAGYRPFEVFLGDLIRSTQLSRLFSELGALRQNVGVSPARLLARSIALQLPAGAKASYRRYQTRRNATVIRYELARESLPRPVIPGRRNLQSHLAELLTEGSLPHLLRFEDRNSMAVGVEARVPFVDYRLVEFSLKYTADARIRDGWTKWVLRQAMDDVIPPEIAWRRDKIGFQTPEESWLRSWFAARPDFFGNSALSGAYLELPAVRQELDEWSRGAGDASRVWRWINLELWLKVWSGR